MSEVGIFLRFICLLCMLTSAESLSAQSMPQPQDLPRLHVDHSGVLSASWKIISKKRPRHVRLDLFAENGQKISVLQKQRWQVRARGVRKLKSWQVTYVLATNPLISRGYFQLSVKLNNGRRIKSALAPLLPENLQLKDQTYTANDRGGISFSLIENGSENYSCTVAEDTTGISLQQTEDSCVFRAIPLTRCVFSSELHVKVQDRRNGLSGPAVRVTLNWPLNNNFVTPNPPAIPEGKYFGVHIDRAQRNILEINQKLSGQLGIGGIFIDSSELNTYSYAGLHDFIDQLKIIGGLPLLTITDRAGLDNFDQLKYEELACFLSEQQSPIFLRWGHEMNGNWYAWGQKPELYKRRFRSISKIMHGVARNVAMVWSPNQGWGYPFRAQAPLGTQDAALDTNSDGLVSPADDPYLPYFPGSEYVDWIGLSAFHFGNPDYSNSLPDDDKWKLMSAHASLIELASSTNKPLMLAETAAWYEEPANADNSDRALESSLKLNWLQQVLETAPSYNRNSGASKFKAIVWFNVDKIEPSSNHIIRWSFDQNESVVEALHAILASGLFEKPNL